MTALSDDNTAPLNENPRITWVAGGILLLIVWAVWSFFSANQDTDRKRVVVNNVSPKNESSSNEGSINDADASLRIFNAQLEKLQQTVNDIKISQDEFKKDVNRSLEENKNESRQKIDGLIEEQLKAFQELGGKEYEDILGKDKEGRFGDLESPESLFEDETNGVGVRKHSLRASPYGENYILLSQGNTRVKFQDEGKLGDGLPNPVDVVEERARNGINSEDRVVRSSSSTKNSKQKNTENKVVNSNDNVEIITLKIPALSKSPVTTLFGINCPIGGALVNKPSDIPARPVVLPVTGVFRGPNGAIVDIGKVHLYGSCSARRTGKHNIGRAEIKINRLSYWDSNGNAQFIAASGFLIDDSDNSLDMSGYIDKVSRQNMFKQAASMGALAYAATLSSKEYTSQTSPEGSLTTLSGDEVKAGAASGATAFFNQYAQRWLEESLSDVDTVHIPAGRKGTFISDIEISVTREIEKLITSGENDVLI